MPNFDRKSSRLGVLESCEHWPHSIKVTKRKYVLDHVQHIKNSGGKRKEK